MKPEDQREAGDPDTPFGAPIPADHEDSPLRAGVPYEDPHENVVYRIVTNLNVAEGWGTAAFWTARWNCNYLDILHFAQLGWLDAAIAKGSSVKRYRCREEARCIEWLRRREHEAWQKTQKRLEEERAAAAAPPLPTKPFAKRSRVFERIKRNKR